MAKGYNIRWSDKDERELKRLVTNFNAKLYYQANLAKNKVDSQYLPDRLRMKDLRPTYDKGGNLNPVKPTTITTRADLNRVEKSIKRFAKTGSTDVVKTKGGVVTTKYVLKEANIKKAVVERKRTAEAKKLNLSTDKGTGHVLRQENLLTKMKAIEELNQKDFDKRMMMLEKEIASRFSKESAVSYVANMKKGYENELGSFANNIFTLLEGVDEETIRDMSLNDPVLLIDFAYGMEHKFFKANQIYEHWEKALSKV